jgi:hypothetical protein
MTHQPILDVDRIARRVIWPFSQLHWTSHNSHRTADIADTRCSVRFLRGAAAAQNILYGVVSFLAGIFKDVVVGIAS